MATRTTSQSGPVSDSATFGGSAFSDGDIIVVTSGHTLTIDTNITTGSNAGAAGIGITINGTNSGTFGKVVVNSGVTLTLEGNDTTTNAAMRILQWGMFQPNPGSIILCDCASEWQTIIRNEGRISAIGTSGSHITFGVPAANKNYNNDSAAPEAKSNLAYKYDRTHLIACCALTNVNISNAAGDGPGVFGDSSLSFASVLTTEVATKALVTGAGKYFVDYDLGLVYFYLASGTTALNATYKYTTNLKGWGINSITNQTGHEALFEYCDFSFMGSASTSADRRVLDFRYKQTAAVASDRLAYVKNCTFTNCSQPIGIKDCTGTSEDLILITGNTINMARSGTSVGSGITAYRASSSYIKIDSNTIKSTVGYAIEGYAFGTEVSLSNWTISNNTFHLRSGAIGGNVGVVWPDLSFSNNTIYGSGSNNNTGSSRAFTSVFGTSGHPVTFSDNLFHRIERVGHLCSYNVFERNRIYGCYHHGVNFSLNPDTRVTSVIVRNNLFYEDLPASASAWDSSTRFEIGYWDGLHLDDIKFINNTIVGNPSGGIGFGNIQDPSTWITGTRIVVANNLLYVGDTTSTKAYQRRADAATVVHRFHVTMFDYNLDYNYATRYTNLNRQGSFTKSGINYNDDALVTRNITGVALFDPNFSTKTNGTLAFTYTSATDMTLAWDGGTAIQLVLANGTAESSAQISVNGLSGYNSSTFTDAEASWTDTKNDANCPVGHWVKITGGTGSGQIRMVIRRDSATVLRVVPAWTTPLSTDSTYSIIKSEVTLDDGADTVKAGIYLPDLPTSTQSDTSVINFADNSVTGSDPSLVDPVSSDDAVDTPGPATDYYIEAGSPAISIGTSVYGATLDYIGTTRSSPDAGFFEYVAPAAASGAGPGTYLRWTAGMLNNRVPPHYRR